VLQLAIEGPTKLRPLDRHGKPIASKLPYALVSNGTLEPTELRLTLGGEMTYFTDSPRIVLCATGRNHPLAMEADFLKAQEAYRRAANPPGSPLYVTSRGPSSSAPRWRGREPRRRWSSGASSTPGRARRASARERMHRW